MWGLLPSLSQLPTKSPGFYEPPEGGQGHGLLQPLATGLSKHLYSVGLAEGLLGLEERVEGL